MSVLILEWSAFGGSLLSLYLYGKRGVYGPIMGIITSVLFMVFGIVAGIYAASIANIVFLILHTNNLRTEIMGDQNRINKKIADAGNTLTQACHNASKNAGWWNDIVTGEPLLDDPKFRPYLVSQKLCLIHSEISEAMEGDRKNLMDDHLPHRSMLGVELADAMIRISDLAGALDIPLGDIIAEKMEYNANRPDHKVENRKGGHGKSY